MNQVTSIATRADPTLLIEEMAYQIYAGILGGLDTSKHQDVIQYLYDAPQRYHRRLILDHYERALYEAKQMMVAVEISR